HWNQNHFVVLYRVSKNGKYFHVADPGKGRIRYTAEEFVAHWCADADGKGIVMALEPTDEFKRERDRMRTQRRGFRFIMGYMARYRRLFSQIVLGLLVGSLLQLALPFLTQAIVDVGIRRQDIGIIWLILLGELMIVVGRTASDFIRRRLLLHISMRINISLVSDFFVKLLKLPMSYFDRKLTGDLMQRIADHSRVQGFLTQQVLTMVFALFSFLVFSVVLAVYDLTIFAVFMAGSVVYGLWIAIFLRRRKVLDYELFEKQSANQNKTFQFLTAMQEIKLQDCEQRRRWEWEDTQADLFDVQMKNLKLVQSEEAGAVFINEVKKDSTAGARW
ncbi:MAG: peptidase domain-containing ABC transporter, partial [Muribaculaceae bacterium]|nr:peptidase domain-containing ABC transporter [Muribaculaceae bacterium]